MRIALYIPNRIEYPFESVKLGLERAGHTIVAPSHGSADWLVTWTPWNGSQRDSLMKAFGPNRTVVIENGWLSPVNTVQYYQIAIGGWNGRGKYKPLGTERWRGWVRDWELDKIRHRTCTQGDRRGILVLEQIGHPHDDRTAPRNWCYDAAKNLIRHYGAERVRIRLKRNQTVPLLDDVDRAEIVVTHSSNATNWALLKYGVKVFAASPSYWFSDIAERWDGEGPLREEGRQQDPYYHYERAAWAQWNTEEIRTGQPFDILGLQNAP